MSDSEQSITDGILDLALDQNDARAETVRGYLIQLLRDLWREEEGFSGKRPFGNSGWQYEIYAPLVKAGYIAGSLDQDGYLDECDTKAADRLMDQVILALGNKSGERNEDA